jgi:hypothetical protein
MTRIWEGRVSEKAAVRENIVDLVGASAEAIAKKLIEDAEAGQLAAAKYLFEMAGIYPPAEQAEENPAEESLAATLLRQMGLPLGPVTCGEESAQSGVTRSAVAAPHRTTSREGSETFDKLRAGHRAPIV